LRTMSIAESVRAHSWPPKPKKGKPPHGLLPLLLPLFGALGPWPYCHGHFGVPYGGGVGLLYGGGVGPAFLLVLEVVVGL